MCKAFSISRALSKRCPLNSFTFVSILQQKSLIIGGKDRCSWKPSLVDSAASLSFIIKRLWKQSLQEWNPMDLCQSWVTHQSLPLLFIYHYCKNYLVKMTISAGYCSFRVHWAGNVNLTILRKYSGTGCARASSRYQAAFLLPRGLGTRLAEHLSATQGIPFHWLADKCLW